MTGDTNWTPYSVPELAGILDDDLTSAWEQVGAWFSADAMLDDAASKLAEARSGLAAVWPPDSSPAAQTFFQVVDALTDSMKKTALAANTNANALSQVLDNHSDTKSKVEGLRSAWTVTQKMASSDPEFPSPAEWQSSLNVEAQQHMTAADNVINEYASTLVVPPVIPVPGWIDPVTVIPGSDGNPTTPGGRSRSVASPVAGMPIPTGGGSPPPAGATPLPGVPILTGGGSPPPGGGPGRPPTGPGLPGLPPPPGGPGGPGGPGAPTGPAAPGIPMPASPIPVAPGFPGGGLVPGEPGSGGGITGRPGGGTVGFPGEAGFPGESTPGTGLIGIGGGLSGAGGSAGLPPGEVLPGGGGGVGRGLPGEPLPGASVDTAGGGFAAGGAPGEGSLGFVGGAPIAGGAVGVGGGRVGGLRRGGGTQGRAPGRAPGRGVVGVEEVAAAEDESLRGGNVLGRDGSLRPGRPSALRGSDFGGAEFGDGVGPTAADGTLRPSSPGRPGYVNGRGSGATPQPGEGATLVPGESSTGSGSLGDGPMSGGAGGSGGRRRTRRSVADVTWAMPSGGPAVLIPTSEHTVHDPGPGVIGIDR
jgi:hypothetical protein